MEQIYPYRVVLVFFLVQCVILTNYDCIPLYQSPNLTSDIRKAEPHALITWTLNPAVERPNKSGSTQPTPDYSRVLQILAGHRYFGSSNDQPQNVYLVPVSDMATVLAGTKLSGKIAVTTRGTPLYVGPGRDACKHKLGFCNLTDPHLPALVQTALDTGTTVQSVIDAGKANSSKRPNKSGSAQPTKKKGFTSFVEVVWIPYLMSCLIHDTVTSIWTPPVYILLALACKIVDLVAHSLTLSLCPAISHNMTYSLNMYTIYDMYSHFLNFFHDCHIVNYPMYHLHFPDVISFFKLTSQLTQFLLACSGVPREFEPNGEPICSTSPHLTPLITTG